MNKSLIGISAVLVSSFFIFSCGPQKKDNSQMNAPVPVTLYTAGYQNAVYHDEYPGTVVALSQVDLRAEVSGYITGIFFQEGTHVRKGQKLYEIDKSKYQATYNQAQANIQVAKANLNRAQKDADRYIYLSQHDAVAKQILDHAMTDLENAKSQVASANADMVKAQTDLKYAIITAPFDGTIGLSQVKMGALVSQGQTLLNTISTDNPTAVDFVVNEKDVTKFTQLQKNKVPASDSLFTLYLPDHSQYPYPGTISVIDRAVDEQTGTIKVRLIFPNADGALKTGLSCIVRVHSQEAAQQIVIPSNAIVEQMGEYFVFVAKDSVSSDAKDKAAPSLIAVQKKVAAGQTIGANIIIKSGLEPGDRVIVDGVQKLREGAAINPAAPGEQQKGAAH